MTRKLDLMDVLRIQTLREHGYTLQDGWTCTLKEIENGVHTKQLANFLAWPSKEIIFDNGAEISYYFDVDGISANGTELPTARLTQAEFFGNYPLALRKYWGMDIVIKHRAKEELREAMQVLGKTRQFETIYTHTGWRQVNGNWLFLHTAGAVGADNVSVDLSEGGTVLPLYALPAQCVEQTEAAQTAFSLLDIAKPEFVYPLFSAVFLAPLCEVLRSHSINPDFILFFTGRTGSGKSSVAALFLSFFGDFDKNHFPANYRQTAASLERTGFLLKDVMMVVDDFYPAQSHQERKKMNELAQQLARAYGDGAVRQRMRGSKLQESWTPRGLAISTGEERPEIGESGQARFVFIDVNRDDVNYNGLLSLQQQEHKSKLAEFMILYLEWVANNWERIPGIFMDTYQAAQQEFSSDEYSGRINESIAKLCGGLEVVLTFAREKGFVTEAEYDHHGGRAQQAFASVLNNNVHSLISEKPSHKFLTALVEIIQQEPSRFCHVDEAETPPNHLGCYDDDYLYLLPTACFNALQAQYKAAGMTFPVGDKTLWKHLRAEGIIEGNDARNRNTVQVRLGCTGGKNVDVLKLRRSCLTVDE